MRSRRPNLLRSGVDGRVTFMLGRGVKAIRQAVISPVLRASVMPCMEGAMPCNSTAYRWVSRPGGFQSCFSRPGSQCRLFEARKKPESPNSAVQFGNFRRPHGTGAATFACRASHSEDIRLEPRCNRNVIDPEPSRQRHEKLLAPCSSYPTAESLEAPQLEQIGSALGVGIEQNSIA